MGGKYMNVRGRGERKKNKLEVKFQIQQAYRFIAKGTFLIDIMNIVYSDHGDNFESCSAD